MALGDYKVAQSLLLSKLYKWRLVKTTFFNLNRHFIPQPGVVFKTIKLLCRLSEGVRGGRGLQRECSTLLRVVCGLLLPPSQCLRTLPDPATHSECQLSSLNGSLKAFGIPGEIG